MTNDIDFSKPRVILLIGKPRRGKSNSIKYFILKNSGERKHFKFGLVFTGSKFNNDYNYIPDDYIFEGYQENVLENYLLELEQMKKKDGKIPPSFIILDDLVGILNKYDGHFTNFVTKHRHYNITIFLAVQHLNTGASTTLREVCTHALMYRSSGYNTIKSLWLNFGQRFDKYNDWKKFFVEHTTEPFTALLYDASNEVYSEFRSPYMGDVNVKLKY